MVDAEGQPGRPWEEVGKFECARSDPITLPVVLPCPPQPCWEGTMPLAALLPFALALKAPGAASLPASISISPVLSSLPGQREVALPAPPTALLIAPCSTLLSEAKTFLQAAGNCSAVKLAVGNGDKGRLSARRWPDLHGSAWQSQCQTSPRGTCRLPLARAAAL